MSDSAKKALNESPFGELLYNMLPEHYRDRDDGFLAQYIDICGSLMDSINSALDSLHEDFLPSEKSQVKAQPWTLPYTAKLYGASLISPDDAGKKNEIQSSIRWNKRKGTLICIEEIMEAIAGTECIISEGRSKVAISARPGEPVLPAEYYGQKSSDYLPLSPSTASKHPGIPAVTPVLDKTSLPVTTDKAAPDVQKSFIAGKAVAWRVEKNHGVPAVQNSFFDRSLRTLDFREPSVRGGQAHPSLVVLHIPPFSGFFNAHIKYRNWKKEWVDNGFEDNHLMVYRHEQKDSRDKITIRSKTGKPVYIQYRIITEDCDVKLDGIVCKHNMEVRNGNLLLKKSAVPSVTVTGNGFEPVCEMYDSLAKNIQCSKGTIRLEHATVLKSIFCDCLLASDSIITALKITKDRDNINKSVAGFIRYSVLAPGFRELKQTTDLQYDEQSVATEKTLFYETEWGLPGCGVIIRGSSGFVESGAENLGVLGCYNHMFYSRKFAAVQQKIKDFLPIGIKAAVIEDPMLQDKNLFEANT